MKLYIKGRKTTNKAKLLSILQKIKERFNAISN